MKKLILWSAIAGAMLAANAVRASGDTNGDGSVPRPVQPVVKVRYVADGTNVSSGMVAGTNIVVTTNAVVKTNGVAPAPADLPAPSGDAVPQPAVELPPVTLATDTNAVAVAILTNGEKGLRMNFRGVPLETVLNYMSDAAGFIIHPQNGVDVSGKVTVWSTQPLSKEEAVKFLEQALAENGYTAIQDGRTLTILRTDDGKTNPNIPVFKTNDPAGIPVTPKIVTEVIPVRSLNVVQLVKNLQPLLPSNATLSADESANALVLTDTQANIHRIVSIVQALDTVTSGNATITVFPLKYADSKSLATLFKDLFPSQDTAGQNGARGGGFGRFRAMMMGGGPPDGGGGDNSNGHTPTAKVTAVSDDHSNSLIVSAPDELMPTIANIVKEVDNPVEDTTVCKVFELKNADPVETANVLSELFPDDSTTQNDASRQPFGFGRFPFPSPFGQQNNSNGQSDRMKKMARVIAVPDRRTSSLIVTAGKDAMDSITNIIDQLDKRTDRKVKPYAISLKFADPVDVQPILQGLFPTSLTTSSANNNNINNPNNFLQNRAQTQLQNQNNQSSSSSFGGVSGGNSRIGN